MIAGEGENIVSFYVTQRMMQNANVGDELEIQKNGTTYKAYISEINSMVDRDTGLFKVKAQIESTQEIVRRKHGEIKPCDGTGTGYNGGSH